MNWFFLEQGWLVKFKVVKVFKKMVNSQHGQKVMKFFNKNVSK